MMKYFEKVSCLGQLKVNQMIFYDGWVLIEL